MAGAKPSQRREGRVAAMQFLYSWSINPSHDINAALAEFFTNKDQPRDTYAFGEELIHGALEKLPEIDARIRTLLQNWDFERIAKIDLAILRLGVFELLFRKDIPPVVSINEAIDMSKDYSTLDSRRFVNGILDRLREQLDRPARTADEPKKKS